MDSKVLSFVNKLEGFKTAIKQLHWDSKNMSQHELCDKIADRIADFQDQVSEVEQSMSGKLKVNSLKPTPYKVGTLKGFVEDVIASAKSFLKDLGKKGDGYIGMRSDCESFLSDMQRNLYLVNFTLKEELKRRLRDKINESRPKNLANVEDVEKFMGRRPKTMKARINQIYRIVKKYGIDGKIYNDDHWQAKDDYYKAIESLGCEFEMRPCANSSRLDDWDDITSDGGYTDYDPTDHMPRSKQYAVKIIFDDGMKIGGYIKFMACGTMENPFSRYDTCMILWPKNNRVLENINVEMIKEYGDNPETRRRMGAAANRGVMQGKSDSYRNAMDSLARRGSSKDDYEDFQRGFENENRELRLSESELNEVIKEAAMNLISEYYTIKSAHGHKTSPRKQKAANGSFSEGEKKLMRKMGKEVDESNNIEIKPSKRGTFTAAATKHGKSVQAFASQVLNNKDDYSPAMVKKANFARNFGGKKSANEAIDRAISETIQSLLKEEDSPLKVMIDGALMTFKNSKEYKKFLQKKKAKEELEAARARGEEAPKPPKKTIVRGKREEIKSQTDPRVLASEIGKLIYDKSLKSIKTFIMHSERSFGGNAVTTLMNMYRAQSKTNLFNDYNVKYNEINQFVQEIEEWGANNEHAVYERCSRLANSLRDLCDILSNLANVTKTLKSSNKLQATFGNGERNILVGSGDGRELGLYGLVFAKNARVLNNVQQKLYKAADLLEDVAKNGRDPFDYPTQ